MTDRTYRIPETVVEDVRAYRREVEKFLAGETSPVSFRALRVPMGVYEQRESDTYMVRVRGAGGVFLPDQARQIADLAEEFGSGVVHVTTRQDLQIHRVLAQDTPTVFERLLEVGLSSRGGGGNTVRNVTACPLAGVCADEVFDVAPYAFALTEYLIANRANFNLPRKFKAAFSGCGDDCALGSVADLGFFAHRGVARSGDRPQQGSVRAGLQTEPVPGFSVYAGGGMGAHSALGVKIEEFVPVGAIFAVAEAVKRLFDKHGDRTNRNAARLRFVVQRVGEEEFRRLYREELAQVESEGIAFPEIQPWQGKAQEPEGASGAEPQDQAYRAWRAGSVRPQKQDGLALVLLPLALGDVRPGVLRGLADLAGAGDGALRTTQDQDLQLRGIPLGRLPWLYAELRALDPRLVAPPAVKSVACAGASTCRLGICLSRGLAEALDAALAGQPAILDAPIRISGCPNACGQHPIAPIGLYGGAQRANRKLVPAYNVVVGGRLGEGAAALARSVGKVPAKAVPGLLREFWGSAIGERRDGESASELIDRWGAKALRELVRKHGVVPAYESHPEYYHDWGSTEEFSLAGRGPGECGAGVMDVIALDIDTARDALKQDKLYEAILAAARALLVTRGLEPKKDREVFAAFSEHLIQPRWVSPKAQVLVDAALDFRLGDRESLADLRDDVRDLVARVQELFRSLDSALQFRVAPVEEASAAPSPPDPLSHAAGRGGALSQRTPLSPPGGRGAGGEGDPVSELDLRGVACPLNFVHAKIQLEARSVGDVLDILLDGGEPVRNVPASLAEQGQDVVSVEPEGACFRVRVRKVS